MTQNNRPATIRARIHPDAMTRLPRLFNGSEEHTVHELLQNARRGHATEVHVFADRSGRIQVTDNGHGIANPQALLAFGLSDWYADIVAAEDAAGMGVFVLARWGCEIISREAGQDAWRATITPEHFVGEGEVVIEWGIPTTLDHGTIVSFDTQRMVKSAIPVRPHPYLRDRHHSREQMLAAVVRHFPVPTWINGERAQQSDFLSGAVLRETWEGIELGVFQKVETYDRDVLNFFGLRIYGVRLASEHTRNNSEWVVKANVRSAPDLELVLPARKEIVQNEFAARLEQAARLTLLRAFAQADPPVDVDFKVFAEAAAAGIDIPAARPQLRPWVARLADPDQNYQPDMSALVDDAIVVDVLMEPAESQVVMRAAKRGDLASRFFAASRTLSGYAWYDRLPRLVGVRIEADIAGETHEIDAAAAVVESTRAGTIRVIATIQTGTEDEELVLETDVAFGQYDAWSPMDAVLIVTESSDISPSDLADLMRDGFYATSDDVDADSYETQSEYFQRAAFAVATELLVSASEALRVKLLDGARLLGWELGEGQTATIVLTRGAPPQVTLVEATAS